MRSILRHYQTDGGVDVFQAGALLGFFENWYRRRTLGGDGNSKCRASSKVWDKEVMLL